MQVWEPSIFADSDGSLATTCERHAEAITIMTTLSFLTQFDFKVPWGSSGKLIEKLKHATSRPRQAKRKHWLVGHFRQLNSGF
jgi:hypothetical protein